MPKGPKFPAHSSKGYKPGTKYRERDLQNTCPLKEQFAPTPGEPIPQHKRMAGVS